VQNTIRQFGWLIGQILFAGIASFQCNLKGRTMDEARGPRIAIILNDGLWYIRHIAYVHQDDTEGEMVYHCDEHIGGPFSSWRQMTDAVDAYLIKVT